MERVQYTVKLDLTDNGFFDTGWRIKQGDSGNSEIIALVTNNGINMFSTAIIPEIVFKRPDGKSIISSMEIAGSNYKYVFVGNELEIPGTVIMDVKITDSEGRVSTNSVKFECVEDTLGYDPDGSHTYDNPVSVLVENSEINSINSEAWAVGTRNGIPVSEGDETYHNNSKYWAEHSKGGGSSVEWNQIQTEGKKIAEVTIDGDKKDVFAPEGGSGSVTEYGTTAEFEAEKDSFPVGTEYLVTDDYEEGGSSNIYSLDEVLIGKYLGKNLYRKVFETTQATTTTQTDFNNVVIPNAKLTDVKFICETSSAQWVISGQGYLKPNGILSARTMAASGTVVKTTVVCEYTKVGE